MRKLWIAPLLLISTLAIAGNFEHGFLTDYSNLKKENPRTLRYFNPEFPLKQYTKFIIVPIQVEFYDEKAAASLPHSEVLHLKNYMRGAIVKAISDKYPIVTQPGPDVARLRIAITDLQESKPAIGLLPNSRMLEAATGGAAMEAELIDSQTGKQVAAIIETQVGDKISLHGMDKWSSARGAMDFWAQRFRKRLDEAQATSSGPSPTPVEKPKPRDTKPQ